MTTKSPDMTWHDVSTTGIGFEDLTERWTFKIHSTLRYTGRFHYRLWEREVVGPDFFEKTGQFAPIYALEIDLNDEPISMRERMTIESHIRLGRTVDSAGETARIVSEAQQHMRGVSPEGKEVPVCRLRMLSVFTRPEGPPAERRVRSLHACLGLGTTPPRVIPLPTVSDLGVPPVDFHPDTRRKSFTCEDASPHVWGYEQTDPNGHVHAMDYVKVMETFGWDHLAPAGISAADHFYNGCRIVFRSPCFRGGRYLRRARFEHREADVGGGVLMGQLLGAGEDGSPLNPSRPAVAIQLSVLRSGRSGGGAE
ncbi:MAG: hypothetical protein ACE5FC_04260 [Myxococcota bacterium]